MKSDNIVLRVIFIEQALTQENCSHKCYQWAHPSEIQLIIDQCGGKLDSNWHR